MSLRSIDQLVLDVHDADSRRLFREATDAYNAGAFRASIVGIWTTVALDLVAKIRAAAEVGERSAIDWVARLDAAIASSNKAALQKIENELVVTARDTFSLMDQRDSEMLERLIQDRNVCAHPAFVSPEIVFQPTAELVRGHLGAAVDTVLRHGPTPGRKAVERFTAEAQGNAWPADLDDLANYLRARYFDRGSASLKINLAKVVLKGCHTPPDADQKLFRRMAKSAHALAIVAPSTFAEAMDSVVRKYEEEHGFAEEQLLRLVGAIGDLADFWVAFPSTSQPRVLAAVQTSSNDQLIDSCTLGTRTGLHDLDAEIDSRIVALTDDELARAIVERRSPRFVATGLARLDASRGWRGAEQRMRELLMPLVSLFTLADLKALGAALRTNDQVRMAGDVPPMIEQIYDATKKIPGAKKFWVELSAWLSANGRDSDPSDYYAYPSLALRVAA